jgi:hypothetical protein
MATALADARVTPRARPPQVCDASEAARAFSALASLPQGPVEDAWLAAVRSLHAKLLGAPRLERALRAIDLAMQERGIAYAPQRVSDAPAGLLDSSVVLTPVRAISTRQADCRAGSVLAAATLRALWGGNPGYIVTAEHVLLGVIVDAAGASGLASVPLADDAGKPSDRVLVPVEATLLGAEAGVQRANAEGMEFLSAALLRSGVLVLDSTGRRVFVAVAGRAPGPCVSVARAPLRYGGSWFAW